MQLAPLRFTRIEGTVVAVSVQSAEEAKAALKELKHKSKELRHLRRGLVREAKAAQAAQMRAARAAEAARRKGGLFSSLSRLRGTFSRKRPGRTLEEIEHEIARTDELLHNLESCIIQVEGKLLHQR